jgi:hypothetical protein
MGHRTYVANDPEFGWLAFGGNLTTTDKTVSVQPRDSLRQRVYWAPLGVWLTLDSGRFEQVSFDTKSGQLQIRLEPRDAFTNHALLRIEQTAPAGGHGTIAPLQALQMEREAWVIPLGTKSVEVRLGAASSVPGKESK